jgi:hypothetical protein
MKNKFFTFIAFFFLSIAAYRQNNYEEVVYLKTVPLSMV